VTAHSARAPAGLGSAHVWWWCGALAAVVCFAYSPVFHAGYIWDDNAHLTAAPLRTVHGLWRIWFDLDATQQHYPLLHSLFWLEHRAWGDAALGYHIANILLHAIAACLVLLALRRLAVPGAALIALIFALHPVHVESVAWISEQKNTLSAVFYLASLIAYLRFEDRRTRPAYLGALLFFVLGLLTKTVIATLPGALLVIAWWRRGRLSWWQDIAPLVPWFLIGAAAGLFTASIERDLIGANGAAYDLSLSQRVLLAGRALWFYLEKLAWPHRLAFIYPHWEIDPSKATQWIPAIGIVALAAGLWAVRARTRAPLAAFLFFAGSLFPVLGFFNVFPFVYSYVADHFQYLASLGVITLAGATLARFAAAKSARVRELAVLAAAALIIVLSLSTRSQARLYQDAPTLYRATIERNPACWMAYNNLGEALMLDPASLAEAQRCFERTLELRPGYAQAENNLGLVLNQSGRPAEAIPHLRAAIRAKPTAFQTHNNLGIALASSGQPEAALAAFAEAARLNPISPNIQENWAKALRMLGRNEEAAAHFEKAAQLKTEAGSPLSPPR
jgi:tetratricopeptide (TPR) repeat protein